MAAKGLDPAAVMAFDSVAQLMLGLSALPRLVLLLTASIALRSSEGAPRWVSWTGLVLAVAAAVGALTLLDPNVYPILAIGTLLFDVWIAVTGVILVRRATSENPSRLPRPATLVA
jgi:hypothetical protein